MTDQDFSLAKLSISPSLTGLVYNERMLLHSPHPKTHFENPNRLVSIMKHLDSVGLLKNEKVELLSDLEPCTNEPLLWCHSQSYIGIVEQTFVTDNNDKTEKQNQNNKKSKDEKDENHDKDVQNEHLKASQKEVLFIFGSYINKFTNLSARIAVTGVLTSVDKVLTGKWRNSFALVRPPGHHAGEKPHINGFCVFNNIAIAANHAKKKHGLKRICIFDWDIHHGDGTEHLFYKDAGVLFISMHRYPFYPYNKGNPCHVGEGDGVGFNVNVGFDVDTNNEKEAINIGENEYIYAFERIVYPVIEQFKPELVLISSGFDSCKGDPLGKSELKPDGYAYMLKRLMNFADGKIVCVLEGGYDLENLKICSETVVNTLLNNENNDKNLFDKNEIINKIKPNWVGIYSVAHTLKHLKKYWNCLENKEFEKWEDDLVKDFIFQSRKNPKKAIINEKTYSKIINQNDMHFYENSLPKLADIQKFFLKFNGTKVFQKQLYAIFDNNYCNIKDENYIEIKVGFNTVCPHSDLRKKIKQMVTDKRTSSYKMGFRVNKGNLNGIQFNKKQCLEPGFKFEHVIEQFLNKGKEQQEAKYFQEKIEEFIVLLQKYNLNFSYLDLMLVNNGEKNEMKVVDFCYLEDDADNMNILASLKNLKESFDKNLN